ncbi:MAG TPA: hypothetical protein VLN26_11185, partial [Gaiellaceae bacterium]|nr:hypothetical protein [Gaiellaceae bacterium]
MSKRVTISFLIAAVAVVALALTSGASAAPGTAKVKVVPITMKDPGCHWFTVGGKNLAKLTV